MSGGVALAAVIGAALTLAPSEATAAFNAPCDDRAATLARWEAALAADPDATVDAIITAEMPHVAPALVHRRTDEGTTPGARLELAAARLGAMCDAAKAWSAANADAEEGFGAPDRARLAMILERPEFAEARRRQGNAFETMLRDFIESLERLFGTRGTESMASGARFLVLALALAALIGGVLRVVTLRRGRRAARSSGGSGTSLAPMPLSHPEVHLGRAREALSQEGGGREAIREAWLALLSSLERRRWARPDRVKTNRELARELPQRGAPAELTSQVERMVEWYDRTFYSLDAVAHDEARRFVDEVAGLEGQVAMARGAA